MPTDPTATNRRADAMRVIYLLLAFFVLTGIGATCRTTTIQVVDDDCGPTRVTTECVAEATSNADS